MNPIEKARKSAQNRVDALIVRDGGGSKRSFLDDEEKVFFFLFFFFLFFFFLFLLFYRYTYKPAYDVKNMEEVLKLVNDTPTGFFLFVFVRIGKSTLDCHDV